ncbi:MAG: YbjN domain-containing protein [Anaerolineae bacterium]|nr:YbjN domain-containing protein [Anaerolineae bacterium]
MHFQLRRIQYIDFNEQEYNAAFQRLTTELQRYGIETAAFMPDGQGGSEQTEEGQPAAEPSPRGAIFQALSQFFTEDEWNPSEMENRPILAMSINGKNGAWRCYAQAREEQQQFVFYSVNQTNTPENKRSAVAEFITRANYGMIMGNFELDFRDGEVRYKTSIDVEGDEISQALIRNMVYANVTLFDRYLPGLMTVIYGGATPEEAIQSVEG